MPRSRDGTFSSKIFALYQRSEKALVLALMEMLVNEVTTRNVKRVTGHHRGAFQPGVLKVDCESVGEGPQLTGGGFE